MTDLHPGDVIVIAGPGIGGWLIRLAAFLRNKPSMANHVALVHHVADGKPWVVEAEANGVRMADGSGYLTKPWVKYLVSNHRQPKTDEQRAEIVKVAESMLKTPYDFAAIAEDALNVFHIDGPAQQWAKGDTPASVVCSSLAAWVYTRVGLDAPTEGRWTSPADWRQFCIVNGYQ